MKKATRTLLSKRPTSKLVVAQSIAYDQAIANECYNNTLQFLEEKGEQFVIASGWLVGDYVNEVGTAVIPHYWAIDTATHRHLDPTPLVVADNFEYVLDYEIATVGPKYKCVLPLPLLINKDSNFQIRVKPDEYVNFDNFDLNYLFELTKGCQ